MVRIFMLVVYLVGGYALYHWFVSFFPLGMRWAFYLAGIVPAMIRFSDEGNLFGPIKTFTWPIMLYVAGLFRIMLWGMGENISL